MVRLREIPRTAAFAWSTGAAPPLIATGTKSGAVDADFSNETQLELWDLDLDSSQKGGELQPVGNIVVDSRFHDLAWSEPNADHERGIIAGGLESGSMDLWDAEKLRSGSSDAHISRASKHSGAIKSLQFNPFRHELLATAGARGELYITDLTNPSNAFRLGTSAARADDFEALDWNKGEKVPHILVTGSSGGFVTVWDVRAKKESLTLNNYGRKAVSAVAWDPDNSTKLVTAIPNDQDPLVLMWDLRNSNAPEKILRAHDQGVLSLSWCRHDGDLLLSCGKDNKTICWNPHTGQALGEFPVVTNWTFQTRFNPHNPSLLATASFDGKIAVQTLQSTNPDSSKAPAAANQTLDSEDFFAKAQTQPQGASFTLAKAPQWLERPTSVSFGFGGKIVKVSRPDTKLRQSKISLSTFAVDPAVGDATKKFEEALEKGDFTSICESKIAAAGTEEEKADWTVIETLMSPNPRKALLKYLGLAEEEAVLNGEPAEANGAAKDSKDDSSFFDNDGSGDNFLSELASTKGAKTNNPFQILTGSESKADQEITRSLVLGSFDKALDICLKEDRLSDAFMIAICGGQKCIDKAQAAYFKRKSGGPNYLRLLASIVGKNLWDVVYNADLSNWKEVMATLCTFANETEFPDLCEALGDRLEELLQGGRDTPTARKDASFCYLAGSKLEKVVNNWVQELQESESSRIEQGGSDSSFSIHARSLQDFIEKVTVFRQVTKFRDAEQQKSSDWKLAPLYAKYAEYADIAASHGQLKVAEKYLDLLPAQYPAAEVSQNRVKQATKKAAPQAAHAAPGAATQRTQRVVPAYQQPAPSSGAMPYAPAGGVTSASPATASPYGAPATSRGYTPAGYQPPQPTFGQGAPGFGTPQPQQPYGYQPPQHTAVPPPPRNFSSSPAVPPAAKNPNIPNWNDTPDFGSKPNSRRGTPAVAPPPVTSPFANQQGPTPPGPPMVPPFSSQQRSTPPIGPPPAGPPPKGPPRMTSPPTLGHPQLHQPERPPSAAANAYAPPQQPSQPFAAPLQPPIPRGSSPYNPPPAAAPPSNRYAPAPGSTPTPSQSHAPPPRGGPPPNPYAASPLQPPPTQGPPHAGPPHAGPPPAGPPRAGPPPSGPPRGPPQPAAAPPSRPGTGGSQKPAAAPPPAPKHPSGDRTHISPQSQPIYQILEAEMQRVKSKAPATYRPQVLDTEKRLNILFDHLNNDDLLKPGTIDEMNRLVQAIQAKNFDQAQGLFTEIMTTRTDEGSNWMVGVKRLIQMGRLVS